jgi:hypothetical protein
MDTFISYSHQDRVAAFKLADWLTESGFGVWIDRSGIIPATNWPKEIAVGIEECMLFILLLSNASLGSSNVVKELNLAAEKKKIILPIEIESVLLTSDFSYHLSGVQTTSITDKNGILKSLRRCGLSSQKGITESAAIVRHSGSLVITLDDRMNPIENDEAFALTIQEIYQDRMDGIPINLDVKLLELERIYAKIASESPASTDLEWRSRHVELREEATRWKLKAKLCLDGTNLILFEEALRGIYLVDPWITLRALKGYYKRLNLTWYQANGETKFDVFRYQEPKLTVPIWLTKEELVELLSMWHLSESQLMLITKWNPLFDMPTEIVQTKAIPAIVYEYVSALNSPNKKIRESMAAFEQEAVLHVDKWGFGLG